MMRASPVAFLALLALLAGCSAEDSGSETLDDAAETESGEQLVPDSPSEPSPAPNPELDSSTPRPQLVLSPCEDATIQSIEDTVVGQVNAFGDGDFETAYGFASPSFRSGMPVEVFGQVIRINFSELLTVQAYRLSQCEADEANDVATVVVRFDTEENPDYALRYILERIDDTWLIGGASPEAVSETTARAFSVPLPADSL
jgi:hypothetical protein